MNLEEWKVATGAKRFKRTKEEMALGLSPEEALERRLATEGGKPSHKNETGQASVGGGLKRGDLSIVLGDTKLNLRPAAKTDTDYFEHIPGKKLEIVLDQNWYAWYDTLMSGPFEGDAHKLMKFILEQGIGEVLTKFHFAVDVEEYENAGKR